MAAHTFDISTDRGWTDELFRGFPPITENLHFDPRTGGFQYFQDFRDRGLAAEEWTSTAIGSSTGVVNPLVAEIGELLLTSGASDNDGIQAQHLGASVLPAAGKVIAVEWRIKSVALTAQNFFFGTSATDTTTIASDLLTTGDLMGFYSHTGDGVILFGSGNSAVPTASSTAVGTLVADTYARIGYRLEGVALTGDSFLEVRYNGAIVANNVAAATIPNAIQRLAFAMGTQTTAAKVAAIDWVRMSVKG